jgi:hypothetical protein
MATIVLDKQTKQRYVLLGAGFGLYESSTEKYYEDLISLPMLACADPNGEIVWLSSEDVIVLEVDGKPPAVLLKDDGPYR